MGYLGVYPADQLRKGGNFLCACICVLSVCFCVRHNEYRDDCICVFNACSLCLCMRVGRVRLRVCFMNITTTVFMHKVRVIYQCKKPHTSVKNPYKKKNHCCSFACVGVTEIVVWNPRNQPVSLQRMEGDMILKMMMYHQNKEEEEEVEMLMILIFIIKRKEVKTLF